MVVTVCGGIDMDREWMMRDMCVDCGNIDLCIHTEHYDSYCYSCLYEGIVDAEGNPIPSEITKEEWIRMWRD